MFQMAIFQGSGQEVLAVWEKRAFLLHLRNVQLRHIFFDCFKSTFLNHLNGLLFVLTDKVIVQKTCKNVKDLPSHISLAKNISPDERFCSRALGPDKWPVIKRNIHSWFAYYSTRHCACALPCALLRTYVILMQVHTRRLRKCSAINLLAMP